MQCCVNVQILVIQELAIQIQNTIQNSFLGSVVGETHSADLENINHDLTTHISMALNFAYNV